MKRAGMLIMTTWEYLEGAWQEGARSCNPQHQQNITPTGEMSVCSEGKGRFAALGIGDMVASEVELERQAQELAHGGDCACLHQCYWEMQNKNWLGEILTALGNTVTRLGLHSWLKQWGRAATERFQRSKLPRHNTRDDGWIDPWLTQQRITKALEAIPPDKRHGRILDLACGNNSLLAQANIQRGFDFTSKVGLDRAFGQMPHPVHDIHAVQFDLSSLDQTTGALPFATASFDTIVMTAALEHMRNPIEVLREVRRLLIEGGVLVLTTPRRSWASRLASVAMKVHAIGKEWYDHQRLYSIDEVTSEFTRAGFDSNHIATDTFELGNNMVVTATK
jgi:SAM-dependent methyltransferase